MQLKSSSWFDLLYFRFGVHWSGACKRRSGSGRIGRDAGRIADEVISPLPPVMQGGALVVPRGLLRQCQGAAPAPAVSTADTQAGATTPHCASAHPQHGFPL